MITVSPVNSRHLRSQYIDLPFRLYKNDPMWVPPLRASMRKLLSVTNPLRAEAELEHFVALGADGVVLGRISATIHHSYNQRFGADRAFFGFFECEDRQDVADALFAAVRNWAAQRGKTTLIGPYSYTSTQDAGLLLTNENGQPPTLLQTYNPLYYRKLIEDAGLHLEFTFSTYGASMPLELNLERRQKHNEALRRRYCITVRSATKNDLKENLEEIRTLFNSSFASNYEVAPISARIFKFQIDEVRPFVNREGICVIEVDGVPRAFFFLLPDLNELLVRFNGSIGLLDLLRLPFCRRNIKKAVIALIGADPSVHGKGLGRVISHEIVRYAQQHYDELHTMWVDDRNPSSYVLAKNCGLNRTKRYGVFRTPPCEQPMQ